MKNNFPISAIAISLCLAVLLSCSNADALDTPDASSGIPITFSALTRWDEPSAEQAKPSASQDKATSSQAKATAGQPFQAATRLADAADGNATSFTSGDAIGLFAYHNASATPDFMNNQRVTFDGASWAYSPTKYWPRTDGDRLSFYAYYPWRESTDNSVISIDVNKSHPILTYNSTDDRTDLLTTQAPELSYESSNGTVSLQMEHQLTRILFRFRNAWEEEKNRYHLGINYLYISYEANTSLTYNYADGSTTYGSPKESERMENVINAEEYYPYSADEFHAIASPFFIVPDFINGGKMELGIDVYEQDPNTSKWNKVTVHSTPTYIVTATLPDKNNLRKGETLFYDLSYKPSAGLVITLITKVDGWEEVDNDNKI